MSVLNQSDSKNGEEIYFNFINSIKSDVTKKIYENHLKMHLKFCNVTRLSDLLNIPDPQKKIIEYIMSLRERGLASNSISTWLLGIYHLYEINDVVLNKKKIKMVH